MTRKKALDQEKNGQAHSSTVFCAPHLAMCSAWVLLSLSMAALMASMPPGTRMSCTHAHTQIREPGLLCHLKEHKGGWDMVAAQSQPETALAAHAVFAHTRVLESPGLRLPAMMHCNEGLYHAQAQGYRNRHVGQACCRRQAGAGAGADRRRDGAIERNNGCKRSGS